MKVNMLDYFDRIDYTYNTLAGFTPGFVDILSELHKEMFGVYPPHVVYQEYLYNCCLRLYDSFDLSYISVAVSGTKRASVPIDCYTTTDTTKPDIQLGFLEIDLTITE